jgi:hypothetical protein
MRERLVSATPSFRRPGEGGVFSTLRPIQVIASQRVGAKRRPMTGSAKQSISRHNGGMDCFRLRSLSFGGQVVASLLAIDGGKSGAFLICHAPRRRGIQYAAAYQFHHCCLWNTGSSAFADDDSGEHSRGAMRPEFCKKTLPSKSEGAGKTGCALHPRSRVHCASKNAHTSIQVQRRTPGLPCAMALRLIRDRPGDRLSCHHHRERLSPLRDLTPAPGRRTHTTSPYASGHARQSQPSRPSHPTARSRRSRSPLLSR